MATGGIFTIITNDGKQDRMLMATALLHERLRAINEQKQRIQGGAADDLQNLPTLLDIEKTHVLFTNAHFKPFAAIGFEYNKVRPTSGNPTLGQTIQFSIPQFGDFFHDICAHAVLVQPTLTATTTVASDQPLMRWCSFPGERLFQRVQQEVNGNPLDEYTFHATNMHREYRVAPNKRVGWYRNVGQELPQQGYVTQPNWVGSGVAPADITSRIGTQVFTGNQTATGQKSTTTGQLELFIPLLFWYNKDVRLAVPSVAIPYGQRFINIDLATVSQLVSTVPRGGGTWANPGGTLTEQTSGTLKSIELYINNIFVNPEVHKIYIKRVGFSLIRVHRQQLYNATTTSQEVLLQQLKWPIEYLFVGMKVKDYYASSNTAYQSQFLDRWQSFSYQTDTTYSTVGQNISKSSDLITLPLTGTVGITAATGVLTGTGLAVKDILVGQQVRIRNVVYSVVDGTAVGTAITGVTVSPLPPADVTAAVDSTARYLSSEGLSVDSLVSTPTVDVISIKAHGISIYDSFPTSFFNSYTSYHFGGSNINTPEDIGALFIPFCLYPGTYQPSGHINVSRAREFYVNYASSIIGSTPSTGTFAGQVVNGTLVVIALNY